EGGQLPFKALSISRSFRSAQAILDLVDMVLGQLGHTRIGLPEPAEPHRSFHTGRAWRVEVWPPYEHETPEEEGGEDRWEDEARRKYAR
ncbi:hypothetical protein ACQUZR_21380, partial [Aeromonas veronii]|uniref:hypothetical protein n=1 Tax=Aeromonas veronii TaxID=654 RepID=UPI003D260EA5